MVQALQMTLLMGTTTPRPVPTMVLDALESLEITHSDEGRSGFQLTFQVGREDGTALSDYTLLGNGSLVELFNRVIVLVTLDGTPQVLSDGIITHHQLLPGLMPGESKLVVTGEDVSVMMDLEEKILEYPAQNHTTIATQIIGRYARYGLVPQVTSPASDPVPLATEYIPVQHGTDLDYLQTLAARHGYVFYVSPGVAVGTNTAYWGPPARASAPQAALSINMGSATNVASINFQYKSLAATLVKGRIQDRQTNQIQPITIQKSTRSALAQNSAFNHQRQVRQVWLRGVDGQSQAQAQDRAQAIADTSLDAVVTAEGSLETLTYGHVLHARGVVGLRGAGHSYDGKYYVKRVTHEIGAGKYEQRFTLTREGIGTALSTVTV
ncbi:MAG TPA: hypothetical protein V6C57_13125 [Coleofasciculaceae cyanobacterium]